MPSWVLHTGSEHQPRSTPSCSHSAMFTTLGIVVNDTGSVRSYADWRLWRRSSPAVAPTSQALRM